MTTIVTTTKKVIKKKDSKKKSTRKKSTRKKTSNVDKVLVENFVSLQKVMVNMSVKFDNLSTQISKLLELFEISAKALAEKDYSLKKSGKDEEKIIDKMDSLMDQNKTIAKGLTLIHDRFSEEPNPPEAMRNAMNPPVQVQSLEKIFFLSLLVS
jgi:hypothetical protein